MAGSVLAIILQMKVYPTAVRRVGKHAVAICGMVSMGLGSILFVGLDPPLSSLSGMPLLVVAIMFKAVGFATAGPTIAAIATRYADKESQVRHPLVLPSASFFLSLGDTHAAHAWLAHG